MALGGFVLGSPIIYLKGMRRMMFQLSGFYYICALVAEWVTSTLLGFLLSYHN